MIMSNRSTSIEFFRIEFYRIYRIYRICRKLVVLKMKITKNKSSTNSIDSVEH